MGEKLTSDEWAALDAVQDIPRIISDETVRRRLKARGFIESAPNLRKYRQMPYGLTPAGREALATQQKGDAS